MDRIHSPDCWMHWIYRASEGCRCLSPYHIANRNPERVSLVCMGNSGTTPAPEDELCARYIRSILIGEPIEMGPEILSLVNEPSVAKFFDIRWKDVFPVKDLIMCLEYDRFPFVLKARQCGDDIFEITRQLSD